MRIYSGPILVGTCNLCPINRSEVTSLDSERISIIKCIPSVDELVEAVSQHICPKTSGQ